MEYSFHAARDPLNVNKNRDANILAGDVTDEENLLQFFSSSIQLIIIGRT